MSWGLAANLVSTLVVVGGIGWVLVSSIRGFTRRDWRRFARLVGVTLVLAYFLLLVMWFHDLHRNTFDVPSEAPLWALITLPFVGLPLALASSLIGTWTWKLTTDRRHTESVGFD